MTRERIYGADSDFLAWMRKQRTLPSSGSDIGIAVTDSDCIIHRYKTNLDGIGTREVQCMLDLEVKTRGATPNPSQLDTLHKRDRYRGQEKFGNQLVWHFGRYILSMSGTDPDNSEVLRWFRFARKAHENPDKPVLYVREITKEQLLAIFRFDLHPDYLTRNPLRRHHKTRHVHERRRAALGFAYDAMLVKRS